MDLTKVKLGDYVAEKLIGRGGMGEVWEGYINPFVALRNAMVNDQTDPDSIEGSDKARKTRQHLKKRLVEMIRKKTQKLSPQHATLPDDELLKYDLETRAAHYPGLSEERKKEMYEGCRMWLKDQEDLHSQKRAIKVISIDNIKDPKMQARFRREIKIQASLKHDNIVRVVDQHTKPVTYSVMEYVPTIELDTPDKLAQHDMNPQKATHIVRSALEGLIYAHDRGVIHRDVKPANILVTEDYSQIKVTDFGVAKLLETDEKRLETRTWDMSEHELETATQAILGTPWYMSPEQALKTELTSKADLYSLGATYYFFLTRRFPINIRDGKLALVQLVKGMNVPPVTSICPDISGDIEDLVMMLLSKDAARRPTDEETRAMLDDIIEREAYYRPQKTADREKKIQELRKQTKKTTFFKDLLQFGQLQERLGNLYDHDKEGLPHREHHLRLAHNYYQRWLEAKDTEARGIIKYFAKQQKTDAEQLEKTLMRDKSERLSVLCEQIANDKKYEHVRKSTDQKIDSLISGMITDESLQEVFTYLNKGTRLNAKPDELNKAVETIRSEIRTRLKGMAPYAPEQLALFLSDVIDKDVGNECIKLTKPLFEHVPRYQRGEVTRASTEQMVEALDTTLRNKVDQVYKLMDMLVERDKLKQLAIMIQEKFTVEDQTLDNELKGTPHIGLVSKIAGKADLLEKKVAMETERMQQFNLEPIPEEPKRSLKKTLQKTAAGLALTGALAVGGLLLYNDYQRDQARYHLETTVDQHYAAAMSALDEGDLTETAELLTAAQDLAADLPSGSERVRQLRTLEQKLGEARHHQTANNAYAHAQQAFEQQQYESALAHLETALGESEHLGGDYESFITQVQGLRTQATNWQHFTNAQTLYASAQEYLRKFELQPASEALRNITELLDSLENPDETLQGQIETLRDNIRQQSEHIHEYELDIGTYNVCKRRLEELTTQLGTLEQQLQTELIQRTSLTSMHDRVANIITRLNDTDQIRPEGVGHETLSQTQTDATSLQNRITAAFSAWDQRALETVQQHITQINSLLEQSQDYLAQETAQRLSNAQQLLGQSQALTGQVQAEHQLGSRLQELNAQYQQLTQQRTRYSTLEQQDTDESRIERARMHLSLAQDNPAYIDRARALIEGITNPDAYATQIQQYQRIFELEQQVRDEEHYVRRTPTGLVQAHIDTYARLVEGRSLSNVTDMLSMFDEYDINVQTGMDAVNAARALEQQLPSLEGDARTQAEAQLQHHYTTLQGIQETLTQELEQNGSMGPAPELTRRIDRAYRAAGIDRD